MNLKIEDVASSRSFVFLWCGSYEGLDLGREVSHKIKKNNYFIMISYIYSYNKTIFCYSYIMLTKRILGLVN